MDRADPTTPPAGEGHARDEREAEVDRVLAEVNRGSVFSYNRGQVREILSAARLVGMGTPYPAAAAPDHAGEIERLREDRRELTKALTGLTCGGSEFFVRRGEEYMADIPACLAWIRRAKDGAVRGRVEAIKTQRAAEAEAATLREALTRIVQWADAYPPDIFPVPDKSHLAKAHEVLTANGMSLDALSAHAMRRVVNGVEEIARKALAAALRADTPPSPTVDHVDPINGDIHRQDPGTGRIVATVRDEPSPENQAQPSQSTDINGLALVADQRRILSALAAAPRALSGWQVELWLGPKIGGRPSSMLVALRHAGLVHQIGSRWAITDEGRRVLHAEAQP